MPEISPWVRVFISTKRIISFPDNFEKANKMGKFASPSRKKGSGLGIAYSIMDKKRQRVEKKTSLKDVSFEFGIEFSMC